jgi:hypothetical protein
MRQHTVTPKNLKQNQAGMVSFFVVMIIMAIITLIVIAYAQITRREQRQALDRQLNSQAFYAAETGINDAVDVLKNSASDSPLRRNDYTECSGKDSFEKADGVNINMQLSAENGISYSCLLVDATPRQLSYDNIAIGTSQVIPILPKNDGRVDSLSLSWGSVTKANTTQKSGCPTSAAVQNAATFRPSSDNCEYAVLRVELVPFSDGDRSRTDLIKDRAVYFAQPVSDDVGQPTTVVPPLSYRFIDADQDDQGKVVPVVCAHKDNQYKKRCAVNFSFSNPNFIGYIRVTSLYHASDLLVTGSSNGVEVEFAGAQAEIDVTGKAGDVLKRIRAYRALGNFTGTPLPDYALQSTKTQCKRFNADGSAIVVSQPGDFSNVCNPLN